MVKSKMIEKLLIHAAGAAFGFFLAASLMQNSVTFSGGIAAYIACGVIYAGLEALVAPLLKIITFPLRLLTFNLFSLVIDMAMVWIVDGLMPELKIIGLGALFLTTLTILILNVILWQILSQSRK
jgi:putative membrane protein